LDFQMTDLVEHDVGVGREQSVRPILLVCRRLPVSKSSSVRARAYRSRTCWLVI
jgi:hypothetical protein